MDFSDIFSYLFSGGFGGFGDSSFFNGFGGGSSRRTEPRQGASPRTNVTITFDEAIKVTTKNISIKYKDECHSCHGTGAKAGTSPITCPKWGGKGQIVMQQRTTFGIMQSVNVCPDCNGSGKINEQIPKNLLNTTLLTKAEEIAKKNKFIIHLLLHY